MLTEYRSLHRIKELWSKEKFFDFFNEKLYSQQVNETNKSKSVETYCTVSLSVAQHFSALFYLSFEQT